MYLFTDNVNYMNIINLQVNSIKEESANDKFAKEEDSFEAFDFPDDFIIEHEEVILIQSYNIYI